MNDNEKKLLKSFLFFSVLLMGILLMIYRKLIIPQQSCLVKINKDIAMLQDNMKILTDEEAALKTESENLSELKKIVDHAAGKLVKKEDIKIFPGLFDRACRESEFDILKVSYNSLSERLDAQSYMDLNLAFESKQDSLKRFTDYLSDNHMPAVVKKISYQVVGENLCRGSLMIRLFCKSSDQLFTE
jgi:cell division protein FtsL